MGCSNFLNNWQAKFSQTGHASVYTVVEENPFAHQCLVTIYVVALSEGEVDGRLLIQADQR
jgi:hypothetical protein